MNTETVTARDIIKKLDLAPHPEGGYFREIYRSDIQVLPELANSEAAEQILGKKRSAMTSIYFLLEGGDFSAWHRVKSDEVWNLFLGGPLELHQITKENGHEKFLLAKDFGSGFLPQQIIRAGTLQAARPAPGVDFVLCSCIVAPGFDFDDFEMPSRIQLMEEFPKCKEPIVEMTR